MSKKPIWDVNFSRILSIVLAIVLIAGLSVAAVATTNSGKTMTKVDDGEYGIVTNQNAEVVNVLDPGFHATTPIVKRITTVPNSYTFEYSTEITTKYGILATVQYTLDKNVSKQEAVHLKKHFESRNSIRSENKECTENALQATAKKNSIEVLLENKDTLGSGLKMMCGGNNTEYTVTEIKLLGDTNTTDMNK